MTARSYDVFLGDVMVGWLAENEEGRIGFRIAESYRTLIRRPVFSQSVEDDLARVYWGKRGGQLPAFFANLLPEGTLRSLIETSLALKEKDDLALLAAVGTDLPGALSLRPSEQPADLAVTSEATEDSEGASVEEEGLRFSLAGAQLKFSMVRTDDRFTLPGHDHRGDWIVKIGSRDYAGVLENEYAMLTWAELIGFEVPQRELLTADQISAVRKYVEPDARALAIRRYDRVGGDRLHQEDFAQVIGTSPGLKYDFTYDQLLVLVRAVVGDDGFDECLRRIAFVVGIGNADAHLKNWSLLYRDPATPSLAPVYDQVSTIAWPRIERKLALKLAGVRDFGRVSLDSFRLLARRAQMSAERAADAAGETMAAMRDSWTKVLGQCAIPESHARAIRDHWQRVPLLRDAGDLK